VPFSILFSIILLYQALLPGVLLKPVLLQHVVGDCRTAQKWSKETCQFNDRNFFQFFANHIQSSSALAFYSHSVNIHFSLIFVSFRTTLILFFHHLIISALPGK